MKLSEKLSEIKQDEGALNRLYLYRESLVRQEFQEVLLGSEAKPDVRQRVITKFDHEKKAKIDAINIEIDNLKRKIIKDKNLVNQRNIELGLDERLIEMKYLRLELAKLMNLVKNERISFRNSYGLDLNAYDTMGISVRIKELEKAKNKLDAQIQFTNWTKELVSKDSK